MAVSMTDQSPGHDQGYDRRLIEEVRLIDARPGGGADWELDVTPYWTNLSGNSSTISIAYA